MLKISKLTTKKTKCVYIIVYIIYSLLYLLNPIFIMKFIDYIVDKNIDYALIFALCAFINFVLIQLFGFLLSICVGKVERENYINFYLKIYSITKENCSESNSPSISSLSQYMGEYYEKSNAYFFTQKVELIFSIINIISIFIVMFILDYRIAFILLIFVPISFLITKKFEKKLYYNAGKNIKNSDQIKKFILDQKIISKEEKFSDYKQMTGFDKLLKNYNKDYKHSIVVKSSYLYFFSYTFLNFAILLVIFLSGYLTYVDILSIGSLFAFQNYTSQLWNPGEYLMSYNSNYQEVKPILNKINSILEIKNIEYIDKKINNIKLNNYCALDINNEELFNHINIEFKCGNIYLIKGENGIGKTTLIESILGFNNRYKGTISINDDINVKYDDFVYIPSTPYISEFYSEELSKSSSGQKKIAQIKFYLQSTKSVYIIDEPTNFIDQDNKEEIINIILNKLNNDNIIIIISHDKSLERISTDIIYLEKSSYTNLLQ